jgi:hypothetical protein
MVKVMGMRKSWILNSSQRLICDLKVAPTLPSPSQYRDYYSFYHSGWGRDGFRGKGQQSCPLPRALSFRGAQFSAIESLNRHQRQESLRQYFNYRPNDHTNISLPLVGLNYTQSISRYCHNMKTYLKENA